MSKIEYKHLDLSGASLIQRRHKRQVTPPGMWAVTNLLSSPSDQSITLRPDFNEFGEVIFGLSGYENGVITQTFDDTLDILNSAAGLYGSDRIIYFTTYAPFGAYDGDYQFLSDAFATGKAIADSGSYDVKFYDIGTTHMGQKTWRGAVLEINGDGRYHIVDEVITGDTGPQTATIRLRAPTEQDYNANEVDIGGGATYRWTASGGGTNEYYCELLAGGDPGLSDPVRVTLEGSDATQDSVGALTDHEWAYGDGDTLGYSTVYFRDDSGDPDATGVDLKAGYGYDYSLWYNHNPYRATDTKMIIQTGDSSTATSIIYCTPTFKDNFSARDICGPFYANVTEGDWLYAGKTYRYSDTDFATVSTVHQPVLATNGTSWILTNDAADLDDVIFSRTLNIQEQESWTNYSPNDVSFAYPQTNTLDITGGGATYKWTASGGGSNEYYCELVSGGDPSINLPVNLFLNSTEATEGTIGALADHEWAYGNGDSLGYSTVYFADASGDPDVTGVTLELGYDILASIKFNSIVRNSTKGFLVSWRGSFSNVVSGTWTGMGAGWSSNHGDSWTLVLDNNYDDTDFTCTSSWHDGTTLTSLFIDTSTTTAELRYSTDDGTTWNNTTGVNTWTTVGETEAKIISLGSLANNQFVICGGDDNIYYSADGQAFTAKDISADVASVDDVVSIAYNNGDGGSPAWVVLSGVDGTTAIARSTTTIDGVYSDVTPDFELSSSDELSHMFYDPIGARFLTVSDGSTAGVSYLYSSDDYGASWVTQPTYRFGSQNDSPSNFDWSGQLVAYSARGDTSTENESVVLSRDYIVNYDVDLFSPLSEDYRSTSVSNLDGYVVLIGCSDWNDSTDVWDYYPRRIRWSAPLTYNDFSSAGSGTADLKGTGALLYSAVANGRIVIFETNTVGALVPRGDTDDPWDYDVIADNFKILSNPVAVGEVIYVIGYDGLLYSCDGIEEPKEIGASFDLTQFDDFDPKKPAWLIYSREYNSLICYYRDSTINDHKAQMINIGTGAVVEVQISDTGDSSAKSDQPISVVAVEDAALRSTMFSYPPNSANTEPIVLTELTPNKLITGTDTITDRDATYEQKFYGEIESGELYITQEGEKASIKHLLIETYTDATAGDNSDTPYVIASVKSIEDSEFTSPGDTEGTATLSTTALTGVGTAWSNTIAAGDDASDVFDLPCLATQARVYIDSTLQVLDTDYTITDTKEITLTSVLATGTTLYAYWENAPEVKVKVGDFFKSTEGWHRVTAVNTSTDIDCDYYLSSGSETVTHYPAWQMDDGHGRVEVGINRLVEGVQIRLYIIPDYNGTQQSTVAKITGLSIGYVPQGRKIVKATGS